MYKEKLFISGGFSLDYLLLISEYDKYISMMNFLLASKVEKIFC